MLNYLKKEANMTYTENGAATLATSGSDCLDLFSCIGALRHADDDIIIGRFMRAYAEDADTAMRILFYARDIRGGLGERRVFRAILSCLACTHPQSVIKNIEYIPEYGRYDDLLVLLGTPCEAAAIGLIAAQLDDDIAALDCDDMPVSFLGKWLPSVNASSPETVYLAKRVARLLRLTDAQYRRILSALRARIRIVENNLRTRNYTFDYEKLPSRAAFRYRAAFLRNDSERYNEFLSRVYSGEASVKTGGLMPYELIDPFLDDTNWRFDNRSFLRPVSAEERRTLNATWECFEDFTDDANALAVVDTSSSMYMGCSPKPASVALSLGMYFAERSKGAFRGHFITFSEHPQLVELKGDTFCDRLAYAASLNEVGNTDIEAVFELVLKTAVKYRLKQEQLPSRLVIISDMEFDICTSNASITNFEAAKRKFARFGYSLPQIVFWNVDSRTRQSPVSMNEQGVMLVSGCTPRLFKLISRGGSVTPYELMMDIIGGQRYAHIAA